MALRRPSPKVLRGAWALLKYVRGEIKRGMDSDEVFSAERPAKIHDELVFFLEVYDHEEKYHGR
jgi:hypothetical protein